ncbi:MAG: hypothetical protein NT018_09340 [Armatimonadetes bacterium]|nr:hypothetical protein [Armatimonadota bacterium]
MLLILREPQDGEVVGRDGVLLLVASAAVNANSSSNDNKRRCRSHQTRSRFGQEITRPSGQGKGAPFRPHSSCAVSS